MDWMQFTASLVESLAWPLAIFFVFFLFRDALRKLIATLARISFQNITAEFARVEIDEANLPASTSDETLDTVELLKTVLSNSPHSFVHIREVTGLDWTDDKFHSLIDEFPKLFARATIVSRDLARRRIIPGKPGMRLIRQ
jgi:hypothetical protein